jgi:hypothetical protein
MRAAQDRPRAAEVHERVMELVGYEIDRAARTAGARACHEHPKNDVGATADFYRTGGNEVKAVSMLQT